jgi:hypothetical protein
MENKLKPVIWKINSGCGDTEDLSSKPAWAKVC